MAATIASAGGQLEHPCDVNNSTTTGVGPSRFANGSELFVSCTAAIAERASVTAKREAGVRAFMKRTACARSRTEPYTFLSNPDVVGSCPFPTGRPGIHRPCRLAQHDLALRRGERLVLLPLRHDEHLTGTENDTAIAKIDG